MAEPEKDPRDGRPEWVHCIRHTHADKQKLSWCERPMPYPAVIGGFAFQDLDHAAYSLLAKDRILPCPDCLRAALRTLNRGLWEEEKEWSPEVQAFLAEFFKWVNDNLVFVSEQGAGHTTIGLKTLSSTEGTLPILQKFPFLFEHPDDALCHLYAYYVHKGIGAGTLPFGVPSLPPEMK